jgi:predicted acylesterase/phospholipase RssA
MLRQHNRVAVLVCVVGLTLFARASAAQEALVLSGGGSRGLAHVGALLALDSLGRDPRLVVGVSMGAIVGALYAAGFSPDSIHKIATRQNWKELFRPKPVLVGPERMVRSSALQWAVELKGLEFSRGFMPDWRVNRTLVQYLFDAGARSLGDFDRLARRYRTVTVDLETGEPVIIASGDFPRAVRASMAIPGFFTPMHWDDHILGDGGIYDYMPVALARELGGSPIIAVDVLLPKPELPAKDPIALIDRAVSLLVIAARPDKTPADFMVVPEIDPKQSSFSYPDDIAPLVQLGVDAARRVVPRGAGVTPRPAPAPLDSLRSLVAEVEDAALARLVRRSFKGVAPGVYDPDAVQRAVDRLYETGFIEAVWPRTEARPEHVLASQPLSAQPIPADDASRRAPVLIVRPDPRPSAVLDIGLGYDNDRGGRFWSALAKTTALLGAPGEVGVHAALGGLEQGATLSLRRASIALLPLVYAAGGYYQQRQVRSYELEPHTERTIRRVGAFVGLERQKLFPDRLFTASFHAEQIDAPGREPVITYGPAIRFTVPQAVTTVVGTPLEIAAEARFGEWRYSSVRASASTTRTLGPLHAAVVLNLAAADPGAPRDVLPALGDQRVMPGMRWGEERGRALAVAGIDATYPIVLGGHARVRLRAGAAPLHLDDFNASHSWVLGAELSGVWSLPLGLVELSAGANSRGRRRLDLNIGSPF